MGQEKDCTMRCRGRAFAGKALLESDHLLFRGGERVKILFGALDSVAADGGTLRLEWDGTSAEFDLGPAAEKWARKILHPPSRLQKLGVKPGLSVRLQGMFDTDFTGELKSAGAAPAGKTAALIFLSAARRADLARIAALARRLEPDGCLWVIYPKGNAAIREIDVIEAGRAAGLKDTKVASFSSTHTGLRFTIPLAARARAGRGA